MKKIVFLSIVLISTLCKAQIYKPSLIQIQKLGNYNTHKSFSGAGGKDSLSIPDIKYIDSLARKITHDSLSGVTTVGAFSGSSKTNGATISTNTITFGPADGTNPGMIKATGSQTLGATLTMPAPLFTSISSAGTNDSVLTVDPSTGQVHRRTGSLNLKVASGVHAPTTDSIILGGTFNQPVTFATAGFALSATGLPNKSTALSTDSVALIDNAGKFWKLPVPSGGTSYTFANSLQNTSGTINLVGDNTSPGNSFYYGTNGSGTKGFYVLPSTSGNIYTVDGTLTGNRTITGSSNNITFTGNTNFSVSNASGLISLFNSNGTGISILSNGISLANGSLYIGKTIKSDANFTMVDGSYIYQLPIITANRTITLQSPASASTRLLMIVNGNTSAFSWSFTSIGVVDINGNTITNLPSGTFYLWAQNGDTNWTLLPGASYANTLSSSNNLTGQTSAGTVTSFAVPSSGSFNTFRVGGYLTVTAVSLDVIQLQVTYTDETNTSRTQSFFVQGATTGISATGANGYSPMDIRVKQGTTITVSTVLTTGTGSITYDVGASITQLY